MKSSVMFRTQRAWRSLLCGWGTVGGMALVAFTLSAPAQTHIFDVDVEDYTLYQDPINPGREIKLGGFSGLYPVPGDRSGTMFYAVTDRGPTQDFIVATPTKTNTYKALIRPDLAPMLVKVQIKGNGLAQVREVTPLRKQTGHKTYAPISGRANGVEVSPESLYDTSYTKLTFDLDGLDPEGLTMDDHGFFWICEEYRPSIAMVAPDGTVLMRLVPEGCLSGSEAIPTFDILPAMLVKRVNNRGLEGITYAPNGRLYAVVQRPLANPNRAASEGSVLLRIIEVNVKALLKSFKDGHRLPKVRQFLYPVESVDRSVYASDLWALTPSILLVPERKTDKLFAINLASATDITRFETPDGKLVSDPTKTIEQLDAAGLKALKIRTVKKTEILPSLMDLHPELAKCEGLAVVRRTLVLAYDNDFNLADLGDGTTTPGSIVLKSPDVYPALITTPLPRKISFKK